MKNRFKKGIAQAISMMLAAIVLVGDAIKTSNYERSKLYDPAFTTEFRQAKNPD